MQVQVDRFDDSMTPDLFRRGISKRDEPAVADPMLHDTEPFS